ncbi:MAG: YhgE/Pip domain-containing protein, partial [Eggerthellaceae bacterium]|nr:YhgE/Pip domain-containing protein [Eggerthellaceae bacterium]
MLFKGFRFARAEIQNTTANAGIKVAMAAISVIPLLYGALYLLAFLNPYEQLDAVPVAVVNEEAGYEINGEFQVIGNNIVDRLKKTENGLGWNFVTTKQAQEGIEDGTYYMTCTIPKNFSETLASANSTTPQSAQLVIEYNETKNMLASQIGASVWKEVRQQVSSSIAKEFWIHTFSQINRGADDIEEAANGANSLQNGLAEAKNGSQKITDGLGVLNSGAQDLSGGLNKLSSGAEQLQNGTSALSQGAYSLFSGATALFEGSSSLAAGTSSLSQGLDSLSEGSSTLSIGAGELSDSMQILAEGIETLNKGSQTLKTNSQSLASNTLQLKNLGTAPLASGTSGLRNVASMLPTERDVEEAHTAQTSISNGIFTLAQGLDNLYAGLESINDELFLIGDEVSNTQTDTLRAQQQIKDALTLLSGIDTSNLSEADSDALSQAFDLLSDSTGAANTLQSTSAELNSIYENFNENGVVFNGVQTALNTLGNSSQPETLRGGVCAIQSGFSSFSSSAMSLMETSPNLSESIQTIDDAAQQIDKNMGTLSAGAQTLADGTNQLQNGLADASSGSKELKGGSKSIYDATEELHGGILQALAGSIEVNNGTLSLKDGTFQLKQGTQELSNGASTVNDGVSNLSK